VLVTHDNEIAARCTRTIRIASGRIESDTGAAIDVAAEVATGLAA
jgi:ABC-type lipoprotein export system ATPase subunit